MDWKSAFERAATPDAMFSEKKMEQVTLVRELHDCGLSLNTIHSLTELEDGEEV
ncbi:hypothetical protein [Exiguobacterium flavidum]|uniref:hypothetical protein n=1 Tax=Exiguobacterium flavidum TaxID=2184695 RepID=UPI0013006D3C|nr:hypothetical protein [Exiguobacterium flavidum]